MEYTEVLATPLLVETVTDWNMFFVALAVGILSTLATIIAVWYTNKKTRDIYEETREEERNQNAMSVIKPSIRNASFTDIREKLILDNNEDRMLLLSSAKEGFEFYDDDERQGDYHFLLLIRNEGENTIRPVTIEVHSALKTTSEKELPDDFKCVVKLLRRNEGVVLRIHNTEQRDKYWECLGRKETIETIFKCTINYLTLADQQICYEYSIKVTDIPKFDKEGNVMKYGRKTEIIKDEYAPTDIVSIDTNESGSPFRDLQENLTLDGFGYRYRKIGDRQMTGTLDALHRFWKEQGMDTFVSNAATSVNNMNESMKDVANAVNEQREFFEKFINSLKNQSNQPQLEMKEADDVVNVNGD